MSLFWVIAAALLLLALCVPALTLLRRPAVQPAGTPSASDSNRAVLKAQLRQIDADLAAQRLSTAQHAQARAEIERRALEEESVISTPARGGSPRATLLLMLVAVPVLAIGLYWQLGNRDALRPIGAEPSRQDIEVLVQRLADRMAQQPPGRVEDADGWIMLGRTYAALQRYPQASQAFAKALQLTPDDSQLLADQADVLGMQAQSLQGEPTQLIDKALRFDADNLKALALAGSAAFERKDFAAAVGYWSKARSLAGADSAIARGLDSSIAQARAGAGMAEPAPGAAATADAKAGASISGRVTLAPALASKAAADDTLFVFARAVEGPRMPLAILKRRVGDLPLQFTLDDAMAMSPQFSLSKFDKVVVGARISKSGNAMPQSGDLQGHSAVLDNHASHVELVIDSVTP